MNKILIVDDDVETTKILQLRLSRLHFNTEACFDGQKALNYILKSPPSLIILDIKLPSLDGYAILKTIREQLPDHYLPVIFSTADASLEVKRKARELGADGYIIKPYDAKDLIKKINILLPETSLFSKEQKAS